MLGFELDFWDYATFATAALAGGAGVLTYIWIAGLPGRIALARKHPEAEAVKIMGWAGLLPTVLPWIQAFIWAFKPTDIVDIRRFPQARRPRRSRRKRARLTIGRRASRANPGSPPRDAMAPPTPPRDGRRAEERSMLLGFVLLFAYGFIVWLVFFKFRWLKFTIAWGFFSTFFVLHLGHHLSHRLALRRADVDRGARHPAHDPAHAAAVGADARHRRAGRAERPRQGGTPLFQFDRRIYEDKVQAARGAARAGEAERADHEGRHQVTTEKIVKLKSELEYAQVPAEALRRPGQGGRRSGRGRAEVERAGRRRQRCDQGGAGRGAALAAQLPIRDRRREHDGGRDPGRARPGALLPRQHADGRARGRLHHEPAGRGPAWWPATFASARSHRSSATPTATCWPTSSRKI